MTKSHARRDFRHTKIICTLGPVSSSEETLRQMAAAGMNIARLNMSHGDQESHGAMIRTLKKINKDLNHPIAILLDTQGPEIRTGSRDDKIDLKRGAMITLTVDPEDPVDQATVFINYKDIVTDLKVGDSVAVDNGNINLRVVSIDGPRMVCQVIDGGLLGSRRHVNLPGVRVKLPSITEKDESDIKFGLENDIDFIALSFVRSPDDIITCRKLIGEEGKNVRIYAKIENHEGVENFTGILREADGIMIARGDLGVEIDICDLPIRQREMVRLCALAGKPVIVATHLLESMITNPTPTRAEVGDVANAVFEGADAIMLSGETSAGAHPVRCVEVMGNIALRMEKEKSLGFHFEREVHEVGEHLARAACRLADSLGSHAIVVTSHSGRLVEAVASFRPRTAIIYGFTDDPSVLRKLWCLRSVVPLLTEFTEGDPERAVQRAMRELQRRNRLLPGDPVVVVSDIKAGHERIEALQVRTFDIV